MPSTGITRPSISDGLAIDGPQLSVRIQYPNNRNATDDKYGELRTDLKIITIEYGRGPHGGNCILESQEMFITSDECLRHKIDDMAGTIVTIEATYKSFYGTNTYTRVIFRGRLVNVELTFISGASDEVQADVTGAVSTNGVRYTYNDWDLLMNRPVEEWLPYQIGSAVRTLNNTSYLWDVDTENERYVELDESLYDCFYWHNIKYYGEPLGRVISLLFSNVPDTILDFEYDTKGRSGKSVLIGRYWKSSGNTLTVGRIGADVTCHERVPDTGYIEGNIDYSSVINVIVGKGDVSETLENILLEPGWDKAHQDAVEANKYLIGSPGYWSVGRIYALPNNCKLLNYIGAPIGGEISGDDMNSENIVLWSRPGYFNWAEGTWVEFPWATEWKRNSTSVIARVYRNVSIGVNDRALACSPGRLLGWRTGAWTFLEFSAAQVYEYYNPEQQALRALGRKVNPNWGFVQFALQAVSTGDQLQWATGKVGKLPYFRKRFYHNMDLKNFTIKEYYNVSQTEQRGDQYVGSNFNALGALQSQMKMLVEETSKPLASFVITLWYIDTVYKVGSRIDKIVDTHGDVLHNNLSWFVTRKKIDNMNRVTYLYVSSRKEDVPVPGTLVA